MLSLSDESIYNLLPPAKVRAERHVSKKSKSHSAAVEVAPSYSTFPSQKLAGDAAGASLFQGHGATMGRLVGDTINPHNFLKKSQGNGGGPNGASTRKIIVDHNTNNNSNPSSSSPNNGSNNTRQRSLLAATGGDGGGAHQNDDSSASNLRIKHQRLPPIPSKADKPVMNLQTDKNFVHANAVDVICTAPRRLKKEEKRPTESKDFGKVPAYLSSIKGQITQEKNEVEMIREYRAQKQAEQKAQYVRQMNEEERDYLSRGLRQVWAEKYRQYQALPFAKDTALQVSRKENLERELKEIEADLEKLERPVLFVHRDDTVGVSQYAKMQAQIESEKTAKKMVKEAIGK